MTGGNNNHYLSFEEAKKIINNTLLDGMYTKYRENKLIQFLKERQSSHSTKYTHELISKMIKNTLLEPSLRTTEVEEPCPDVNVDEMKAKMMKIKQQRNSSINFRTHEINSIERTNRYKDTISENQFDDSEIHKKPLRGLSNRSSYFSETHEQIEKKKIYRHEKTLTEINPNRKKNHHQSENLLSLIEYETGIKSGNVIDESQVKLNRQIERQIEALRNKKIKLEAAFNSFNQDKMKSFYGEQTDEHFIDDNKEKESNNGKISKNKQEKNNESELKIIITDYNGEIIPPLDTPKLKKVNAKNKENIIKNNFMPIVRVKTEIASNYLELQENEKLFKPSRKYIKHKETSFKPFSTAKESKNSEKVIDLKEKKKVSLYNTEDDWTKLNLSLSKKKNQDLRDTSTNKIFNADEISKSRRMIEKITKSQKKIC